MTSRRRRSDSDRSSRGADKRAAAAAAIVADKRLSYPESLSITDRHDELLDVIRDNQVVIVAGETGSGKSTQLPKICLEAGRGVAGLIGHTQPRRVAARTIAERVAEELGSTLGADVGYTVRFTDQVSDATLVKVMTDGILLAEIQRDRMLRRYDTLIIDEAHERSLNIDFILGYLKQLLPRRPDLKVIVTSATIDTQRFAEHFATPAADDPQSPATLAPIIEVTGRTYPVEIRYRPYGDDDLPPGAPAGASREAPVDQVQAVLAAVDELADEGDGDVLVFLSGEREIHDTADALRRRNLRNTDVLPLYARLSSAEQHRIFQPHSTRRIVLSTNVAETSLTVPGVRYVVDAGTARISRYSKRLKVQRLPIEPISQASANQRSGRCGRVAPGIAIRLFAEDDFEARPEFTDPEILRTNLASVILQMTAIGLGDVANFPFVEPPESSMIRDGYALLDELAAIEPAERGATERELTEIGRRLAKLPIDPRLGRMVLAAERHGCVRDVLVIAAALSIQDPRERPDNAREKANELHNRFKVEGSDLLSLVALWDHLRAKQRELSGNQFRRLCKAEYLNYLRVREWTDLYSQLRRVAGGLGLRPGTDESHPDNVHQALLTGLLSQVGMRDRQTREYRGARDARFVIARGSVIGRKQPDWVMAAELVETNRLYARRVAAVEPEWIERAGAHLVKRSHSDPRWDERAGRAVVAEQVTLFGLPVISDRVVGLDRSDIAEARAWFITKALVEGKWSGKHPFVDRNRQFLDRIAQLAARVRRVELVDDEALFEWFDDRVGDDVTSARHFDTWWKQTRRENPTLLDLTEEIVEGRSHGRGVHLADFPDVWRHGDIELPLTYRYAPGEPLDGVTVHVPLHALNQIEPDAFEWQIPGHREEIVGMLVRSVPKALRRELSPLGETVEQTQRLVAELGPSAGPLLDVVARAVREVAGVDVDPTAFDPAVLHNHLRMNIVVSDEHGDVRDVGTDLVAIKARQVGAARASVAAAAPIEERRGIVEWDFGDLPQMIESSDRALDVVAYPTLLDLGDSVALRVVTGPDVQARAMRGGVRRLLLLTAAPTRRSVERLVTNAGQLALANADVGVATIADDCIAAAVDHVLREHGSLPWTADDFGELSSDVRRRAPGLAQRALAGAVGAVAAAVGVQAKLATLRADVLQASVNDANVQLGRLIRPGFVLAAGLDQLPEIERYVRAIGYRLDHLAGAVDRDLRRMAEVLPLEQRYARFVDRLPPGGVTAEIRAVAWQLEELRVSLFAQPIGVVGKPSPTRLAKTLTALRA